MAELIGLGKRVGLREIHWGLELGKCILGCGDGEGIWRWEGRALAQGGRCLVSILEWESGVLGGQGRSF